MILWGTEISRTEGIGVAEFMYLLGCKPVWADNGKVLGVEQIPLSELTVELNNGSVVNRPRVDVFASMVTNNKDWITWMLTAVQLAADAPDEDETNNFVKKHYAENPTLDRLFGLPGNVLEGTGMSNLIPNTADWNISTVNEYAMDIYLNKVSYSWTLDEKGNIVINKQKDTYMYLLENVDVLTQNFDSSWRLFDSDDYYDWFGGALNAINQLKKQAGKEPVDTMFFDIRNKNNIVVRSYMEEFEFEVRSMLLNPHYTNALIGTPAGMNSYAEKVENLYGSLVLSGEHLNTQLGNQLAEHFMYISSTVNDASLAPGSQSFLAWMIYMGQQDLWDADSSTLQRLIDEYMRSVIKYGVACCHHTCKNLAFSDEIIQASSLTPAEKQKFAEILAQATNTEQLYTDESGGNSGNANTLANGTSQEKSSGSNSGGQTAIGEDPSQSGTAQTASDAQSSSSSDAGASGAQAYELSQKSASKSTISAESSMPIFVIIAIIILIAIFLVGYVRKQDEYNDDY